MNSVECTINYLGVIIDTDDINNILSPDYNHYENPKYCILEKFFNLPLNFLPSEVLERYIEITKRETYTPIFPINEKLFENLLAPLKSAKRCYCLEEYVATIELSAHLGEMLAILVWKMIKINGKAITPRIEKKLLGDAIDKAWQAKRIEVLTDLEALDNKHVEIFDFLRKTRVKYFHWWNHSIENAKQDAMKCFLKTSKLVREILQIEIKQGAITMNPLLNAYIKEHRVQ